MFALRHDVREDESLDCHARDVHGRDSIRKEERTRRNHGQRQVTIQRNTAVSCTGNVRTKYNTQDIKFFFCYWTIIA